MYLNRVDNTEDDWSNLWGDASYRCQGVLVCMEGRGQGGEQAEEKQLKCILVIHIPSETQDK